MRTLRDLLKDRCPNCRQVSAWRSLFRMYDSCPNCGVQFEREPGYFLGAMLFSWLLIWGAVLPVWFFLYLGLDMRWEWTIPILAAEIVVLLPFFFHMSRELWMYVDYWVDPPNPDGESDIPYRHKY